MKYFCYDNIVTAVQFDPLQSHGELDCYIGLKTGTVVNVGDWIVRWPTGDLSVFSDQSFATIFSVFEGQGDVKTSGLANADGASVAGAPRIQAYLKGTVVYADDGHGQRRAGTIIAMVRENDGTPSYAVQFDNGPGGTFTDMRGHHVIDARDTVGTASAKPGPVPISGDIQPYLTTPAPTLVGIDITKSLTSGPGKDYNPALAEVPEVVSTSPHE